MGARLLLQGRIPLSPAPDPQRPLGRGVVLPLLTRWSQTRNRLQRQHANHMGHKPGETDVSSKNFQNTNVM
jgi:hypothetical protein